MRARRGIGAAADRGWVRAVLTSRSTSRTCGSFQPIAAVASAILLGLGLSSAATAASATATTAAREGNATARVALAGHGPKPKVWTVGIWHGKRGRFQSIQAAVDAASPGDWIVIAPGDYKERGDYTTHPPTTAPSAGVLIDKPNLHLLGLSRNGVIVDGTRSGPTCSASPADQDRGPVGPQRHRGLRSQRGDHPEPYRLQLPVRPGQLGKSDLVERRRGHGPDPH